MFERLYAYVRKKLTERRPYTIRFTFTFLLTIAAMFSMANIVSREQAGITLAPRADMVRVGDTFIVDVFAEVFEPVNAVRIDVKFDNRLLELVSLNKSQSVLTLWTEEPFLNGNTIVIEGGTYRRGFVGRHQLTALEFRVLEAGTAAFEATHVRLFAGDGTGRTITPTVTDGVRITTRSESDAIDLTPISKIDIAGIITLREVSIFMADWRNRAVVHDFNNDGVMDFRDFSILLSKLFRSQN